MARKIFFSFIALFFVFAANAQNAGAKSAQVDVTVANKNGQIYPNEVVIFKGGKAAHEYQAITDSSGRCSLKLPVGDKYEILILGFKDSTSYMVLDIPELKGNAYYTSPFKVDIDFTPANVFELDGLNFDFGKATIQPGSEAVLDELVKYLNRRENERIEIGGHTDNVGSAASNLKLSQERAKTVVQYLISKGIAPERLVAKGYGMTVPIESNKTEEGRAANRRTEVKVLE